MFKVNDKVRVKKPQNLNVTDTLGGGFLPDGWTKSMLSFIGKIGIVQSTKEETNETLPVVGVYFPDAEFPKNTFEWLYYERDLELINENN